MFVDGVTALFTGTASTSTANECTDNGLIRLRKTDVESLEVKVLECIRDLKITEDDRVILVAVGLDVLLAATESPAHELLDAIQEWRQVSRHS